VDEVHLAKTPRNENTIPCRVLCTCYYWKNNSFAFFEETRFFDDRSACLGPMIMTVRILLQDGSTSFSWNTLDPHGKDKKKKLAQQCFF